MASMTPGAGVESSSPTNDERLGGYLGAQLDPVLLEVHDASPAGGPGVGDGDVGLDPVVGHRQQGDAGPVPGASQRRQSASVTWESG